MLVELVTHALDITVESILRHASSRVRVAEGFKRAVKQDVADGGQPFESTKERHHRVLPDRLAIRGVGCIDQDLHVHAKSPVDCVGRDLICRAKIQARTVLKLVV